MKPRALDLFCGAGGATKGLQRAGFHVTGVDIRRQPRYCGDAFVQADATKPPFDLRGFDFIWASPPCQAHTSMKTMWNAKQHDSCIDEVRSMLRLYGGPYVIENVPGAPLGTGIQLCGTSFGLRAGDAELRRHRHFESNVLLFTQPCRHQSEVIGVYGGHARNRRRTIGVYGEGARDSRRKFDKGQPDFTVDDARAAMDIDWMTLAEVCQAIPPAYSEFIGRQILG